MKMKKGYKIITGIVIVVAVIVGIVWFSFTSEERNMIGFVMKKGPSYENCQEYQVIERNAEALNPTSVEPMTAKGNAENRATNIVGITEMVKNGNSKMLKKGRIQTAGVADYTGWHVIADEGASIDGHAFGPSPLSYYTTGVAANLHTQILRVAEVKGIELDNVKVEVLNKFRWNDMMSTNGAGFLDYTTTNIMIESDASQEIIHEIKELAMKAWTVGEALKNETVIKPTLVINGDNWNRYQSSPGTVLTDESFDGNFRLSSITDTPKKPYYLEQEIKEDVDERFSFETMSNLEFEIFAISESAENSDRPYLKKITISTPTPETWEIFSDEFIGANDHPLAPTSLEYFTVGTSLCLTSQMTLVSAMLGLDFTDYRVEQQMDYRQEAINTTEMLGYTDTVHSKVLIKSNESKERLDRFYNQALSLCFAGEGLKGATEMSTNCYLNGKLIN